MRPVVKDSRGGIVSLGIMDNSVTYGYSYYQNQSTMVINSNTNSNHTTTSTTTSTTTTNNNNNSNNNNNNNNGNNNSESKDDFSDCVSSGEDSIRDISVQGGDMHGFIPSRKQRAFTPDNRKDQCYWEKRRKNNEAARRSREKRRLHDMALEKRIVELSRESCILRTQLYAVKKRYGIPREEPIILDNEEQEVLDKDLQALNAASASAAAVVSSPMPPNAVLNSLKIRRASPVGLPLVSSTGSNAPASVPNVTNSNNNDTRSVIFSLPNNSETLSGNTSAPATMSTIKGHKNSLVATTLSSIQHQYNFEPALAVKQEPVDDFESTVLNTSESQGSVDYPSSESYTTSSETFETTTSALMMGKDNAENHINSGKSLESSWYHGSREPIDNGKLVPAAGDLEQKPLQLVVKRRKVEPEQFAHSQEPVGEYHKNNNTVTTTTPNNNNNHLHHHQQSQQQQPPPQQKSPVISPMVPSPHSLSISESPILRTSISTLPLKLRHKVSLPDHTMSSVQLSSPTATVTSSPLSSSSSFSSASAFTQNEAPATPSTLHNGLTQLSEIALSHSNPLPLLKKDVINGVNLLSRCNGSNSSSSSSSLDGNMNDASDLEMKPSEHEMLSRLDPKYVERRKRNNEAARKCRENRKALTKLREVKSSYLESENGKLRNEMNDLQEEVKQLRELLEKKRLEQGFKGKLSDAADAHNSITINT
ncbi:probable basic-leucine zipper transcription factor F [Octopus bimaculoides]|uniref:BZIP domain-containing protein n=1 Tax=Octopus bimaculoides TaxID=37653 RepID=A0A0L8HRW5_OCTBM|nr:probable basic-leucine zipper transcription factor F [Octopus bimaculoides]XP_052831871.1 probable basic-leucine zipper transcription factor F [Octopus bimaculoides]XP_052831872.1 probable basic-leucine zipper transcription factor F [Octopus bimaculoides]XP_052831873.1 probable basic-leucine zipper transcription factor F [Octopus bimaculoides]|eukprot:XP_014769996.1 PREDICTED: probable basic-leucine zipper transcription factor F [Octopus bimaculoides]